MSSILDPLIVKIFIAVIAGGTVWALFEAKQEKRQQGHKQVAAQLGLTFQEKDYSFPLPFFSLKGGPIRVEVWDPIYNLFHGVYEERQVALFEHVYSVIGDNTPHWYSIAGFQIGEPSLPQFSLQPRAQKSWVKEIFTGAKEIEMSSHSQFQSKYVLSGSDETAIRDFFQSDLLDFLAKEKEWCVQGNENWLLVYHVDELVLSENIAKFLKETFQIAEFFCKSTS